MINKEQILKEAGEHLINVMLAAKDEVVTVRGNIARLRQRVNNFASIDGKVEAVILANSQEREKQLEQVASSPYFVRCDLQLNGEELKEIYLGKFQMTEKNIYSWVSPIAQVRFGAIGKVQYVVPSGEIRQGELVRKDQFMIVNGQIKFMASESTDYERMLVYQEHLASKKSEFILPEIVAKMERAQDEVIRAGHQGSFLISGPAGSGKTTLAFHRIAYLTQSPDTAKLYPGWNIIVFVQDESTKKYFSAILPQLGIEEVLVTTFEQWALEVLGLVDYKFVSRIGADEIEKDLYEYYKLKALTDVSKTKGYSNTGETLLKKYKNYLPAELLELLQRQVEAKELDRFDLTLLLRNATEADGQIHVERRVVVEDKRGNLKMQKKKQPLSYSFIIVDEAENYLAEQIGLIKSCINSNESVLYVGDLAQQTRLGTLKEWSEVGEDFAQDRKVILDKVYRNTQNILEYVRAQGYVVNIPKGLRMGEAVVEQNFKDLKNTKDFILKIIKDNSESSIGILYEPGLEIENLELSLEGIDNVKILSFAESQGVEFEVVVTLKNNKIDDSLVGYPAELLSEKQKVARDLWYVALTRSMNQLFVVKIY